jgi:rhodanese-related sulfurtransferase
MAQLLEFSLRHIGLIGAAFSILSVLAILEYLRRMFGSQPISPTLASVLINRKQASILDMRSKRDFKCAHLPNAHHVTYEHLHKTLQTLNPEKPIILVIDQSAPSFNILKLCHHAGFNQLYHLEGGLEAWKTAHLPLSHSSPHHEKK